MQFLSSLVLLSLSLLGPSSFASAGPILEPRQGISILSNTQIASYETYTYYAGAAYCLPSKTLTWSCGENCKKTPYFNPIASGGDGGSVQYWYVGYDTSLKTIIVGFQGTDLDKIIPIITNLDVSLSTLDPTQFPGVPSAVRSHSGFGKAQGRSSASVLNAVRTGMYDYNTKSVTVLGHSLGGALAILSTLHLSFHLPSNTTFRTITYGMPRVGNAAFADLVNSRSELTRINNKKDIIPIVPGMFFGYIHTNGEVHIEPKTDDWISCPGTENKNSRCTYTSVPTILQGDLNDHSGPFGGILLGCLETGTLENGFFVYNKTEKSTDSE